MKQQYRTEDDLQIAVAQYLDARGFIWFHPANERKTKTRIDKQGRRYSPEGNLLKRKGVKRGVPDCILPEHQIVIELKNGKNTLTHDQKLWLDIFKGIGWQSYVCRSLDEVMKILEEPK